MSTRPRARDLGIPLGTMAPGPYNAITDVDGVQVGHVTLIRGEGKLVPGQGPVRTGVTAIIPHPGNLFQDKVAAAVHVINGFGKCVGLDQIRELGTLETPILLTNTLNVGLVADAVIEHALSLNPDIGVTTSGVNPVVGECNDGYLNDIRGRHVKREHVLRAIELARPGPVPEGAVGAGTGMSAFAFKGGIGTASRRLSPEGGDFTVGVLVLANFGRREELIVAGVPVGRELSDLQPRGKQNEGSIIVIVATNAPLSSRQLTRLAKRAGPGLARVGSMGAPGSGDFVIAFSTTNRRPHYPERITARVEHLVDEGKPMAQLFQACVEATEEAIINALLRAETMVGRDGHTRLALPINRLMAVMEKYGRGASS